MNTLDLLTEEVKLKTESRNIDVPIYAIGGIEINDIVNVLNVGIYGIAVSGMITNAINKNEFVSQVKSKLYLRNYYFFMCLYYICNIFIKKIEITTLIYYYTIPN